MQGDVYASDIHTSEMTGHDVISVAVPIRHGGRIIGAIIVEYNTKFMTQLLMAYTDDSETAFVIDSNGFPVASSSDVYCSLNFLKKAAFAGGVSYEQFLQSARVQQWGGTHFTLNDERRIIEYRPLDINNWTLFLISHDLLANPVQNISKEVQYVTAGMFSCSYLLVFTLSSLNARPLRPWKKLLFMTT